MKNTKELKPVLTALYVMNFVGKNDKNTENVLEYAFERFLGDTPRILKLACIGKTEEQMWDEVKEMLNQETAFEKYMNWKN